MIFEKKDALNVVEMLFLSIPSMGKNRRFHISKDTLLHCYFSYFKLVKVVLITGYAAM